MTLIKLRYILITQLKLYVVISQSVIAIFSKICPFKKYGTEHSSVWVSTLFTTIIAFIVCVNQSPMSKHNHSYTPSKTLPTVIMQIYSFNLDKMLTKNQQLEKC